MTDFVAILDTEAVAVVLAEHAADLIVIVDDSEIVVSLEGSMVQTRGRIVIDRGEHFSKTFKFRENGGYDPVDFSTATEIEFAFKKADGTFHVATLSAYDADSAPDSNGQVELVAGTKGDLLVTIPEATTALLKEADGQNISVAWTIAGKKTACVLEKVLDVRDADGV